MCLIPLTIMFVCPGLVNWITADITQEWLYQHPVQPLVTWLAELFDTDGHAFMTVLRLVDIGAEQTIPPRQIEAKI